jgi:RNA polymerase sigma-B factor
MAALPRAELIEMHLPLVRALALRFARGGEPLDDLVQAGAVGLIRAVDRYEPGRGTSFEAYAVPTITGEIRRHLRDRCSTVRIPRRAYEERVRMEFKPLEEDDGAPSDPIAELDDRLALAAALRALPLRERRVVLLAFYGERCQRRIAGELGMSQIHVSRLQRSALARLRLALDEGGVSVA